MVIRDRPQSIARSLGGTVHRRSNRCAPQTESRRKGVAEAEAGVAPVAAMAAAQVVVTVVARVEAREAATVAVVGTIAVNNAPRLLIRRQADHPTLGGVRS